MVFDALNEAFAFLVGVYARGIYDSEACAATGSRPRRTSTAVDEILVGKERRFNRRLERICSHHLVEPTVCSPAAGWENGQVENQVQTSRNGIFKPRIHAANFDELNASCDFSRGCSGRRLGRGF